MSLETQGHSPIATRKDRKAAGKLLRETVPRSAHSAWVLPPDRPDIVSLIEKSNQGRLPNLIPLRNSRMLESSLACFRGSAIIMANDLARLPTTNVRLQSSGDCHLHNFGWFASPERNLVFDLNDFDESRTAPWEWDIKRLTASVVLAGRGKQASKPQQQELAMAVVGEYREQLAAYAELAPLDMWYVRIDANALMNHTVDPAAKRSAQLIVDAAQKRTIESLLPKMTERDGSSLRFKDHPPLVFHPPDFDNYRESIREIMLQYRQTISEERRVLLDRYRTVDMAYKVVGVGSVGLRCSIILMLDPDDCPLVLQVKEARASVLEPFVGVSDRVHHGHRIVHGQRLMQAASDVFLGWASDQEGRCFYFRQLRDMKMSVDVGAMSLAELKEYVRLCGWALARAHAKSGDASLISGYLGSSNQFDMALAEFGVAYADQVEIDRDTLLNAVKIGRLLADNHPVSVGE